MQLTDAEIVRRLQAIRYSPAAARQGRRITSIASIAKQASLTPEQVNRIAAGTSGMSPRSRYELGRVLSQDTVNGA